MMTRLTASLATVVFVLAIATGTSVASLIEITEADPPSPILIGFFTAGLFGMFIDFPDPFSFEEAILTGATGVDPEGPISEGVRAVALIEPGSDLLNPLISDIVTLSVGPIEEQEGDLIQRISLTFMSDAEGLPPLTFACEVDGPCVPETGAFQDLTTALNSAPLTIRVQSDLDQVPELPTLALLATGLAVLGVGRSGRRPK